MNIDNFAIENKEESQSDFLLVADASVDKLAESMDRLIDWEDRLSYGFWLAQEYYHARHATRVTALAATRIPYTDNKTHIQFLIHGMEENDHDQWAINDLENLGLQIRAIPEMPQISAIYQSLFYLVDRIDPCALVGYALLVENLSARAAGKFAAKVERKFGPKSATLLKAHSVVDQKHILQNKEYFSNCTEIQRALIEQTFFRMLYYYSDLIGIIPERRNFFFQNSHLGNLNYELNLGE